MVTCEVYVVSGPSTGRIGEQQIPGGFDYLERSLFLLSQSNPTCNFKVNVAHSVYHGPLLALKDHKNLSVKIKQFNTADIPNFEALDPSRQHGTLINHLLNSCPPESQYIILLDPDCFVLETNLILKMINYMSNEEIGIVGVPYPAHYPKEYSWQTPQLYFSIFDTQRFNPLEIDFCAGGEICSSLDNSRDPDITFRLLRRLKHFLVNVRAIKSRGGIDNFLSLKLSLLSERFLINPRDTGWRIASVIKKDSIRIHICPFIIDSEVRIFGLNKSEFLQANPDLSHLKEHLGWYFFNHALIEGRAIGKQGLFPRFLKRLLATAEDNREKWPSQSLMSSCALQNPKTFMMIRELLPMSDFYSFDSNFAIFHLGHKGKAGTKNTLQILDKIIGR